MDVKRRPHDFKSTWRHADRSSWTFYHWMFEILGVHPSSLTKSTPVHSKDDKVPYLSGWQQNRWILAHALIPVSLHQAYFVYTGHNLSFLAALLFYSVSLKLIAIHQLHIMRRMGHTYGFLDGDKHERDGVPDMSVQSVFMSLITTSTVRPFMAIFLAYREANAPSSINWAWLPLEIGLYQLAVDFYFYWYHRAMHDVDWLWRFHRTHHLTKHPNPLLSLYADSTQELFDIFVVPILAYGTLKVVGLPMGFYEYWICHMYVIYIELFGHSGLRVAASAPSTISMPLRYLNMELVVEDHDLHHRRGWKKSQNYGKQSRVWDRLFGTCGERIESGWDNVDFENPATLPLF